MYDVTKFDLKKYLVPVWDGEISYAEAAFVRECEDGRVAPIQLLYPIEEIISVRNAALDVEYVKGVDYDVDDDGRLLILEGTSICVLAYKDYFFPMSDEEHAENRLATKFPAYNKRGYGYIRAEIGTNRPGMSAWTLAVTYKHSGRCVVNAPSTKSEDFAKLIKKLEAGNDIKIVSTGDSITDGWSASGSVGIAPNCPRYNILVEQYMPMRTLK